MSAEDVSALTEVEAALYAHRTLANSPSDCVCACDRTWRKAADYRAHVATVLAAREAAARAEERERIAQAIEARRVLRRRDNTQGQIDTREALNLAARIARGDS